MDPGQTSGLSRNDAQRPVAPSIRLTTDSAPTPFLPRARSVRIIFPKMKTLLRSLLFSCLALVSAASLVCAAVPIMEVSVKTEAGKLAFEGQTDSTGAFSTKTLSPGEYVVQFHSTGSRGDSFAIVVEAGKHVVVAEAVPGSKFAKGGVVMKVAVDKAMVLKGHIGTGSVAQLRANSIVSPSKSGRVKFINGKKYVWIPGSLGSNLGGHWAEAGSAEARAVQNVDNQQVQDYQQRTGNIPHPNGG